MFEKKALFERFNGGVDTAPALYRAIDHSHLLSIADGALRAVPL